VLTDRLASLRNSRRLTCFRDVTKSSLQGTDD
jgi:hypothetical protein